MDLVIVSINCNGLLGPNKIHYLNNLLLLERFDIVFLQETHVSDIKIAKYFEKILTFYKCFWSFGSNRSCGSAILVRTSLDFTVNKFHFDLQGRLVILDISINDISFRFLNIYCPNNPSKR
ncbi:hypothetical protein LOTGIDRAFT_146024, partial [Lottia gigantea]